MPGTRVLSLLLLTIALVAGPAAPPLGAWGASAHMLLTTAAVDHLQGPLGTFFKANRNFLICYSILPDGWWGSPEMLPQLPKGLENPAGPNGPKEIGRHHFAEDADPYVEAKPPRQELGVSPMDRAAALQVFKLYVDKHGQEALTRFGNENHWFHGGLAELPAAMLEKAGELPWVIDERLDDMARALREGQWSRALFMATVLAHYAGDAHVPLHTTVNFNGQFCPNPLIKGLHQRWEGRAIELNKAEVRSFLAQQVRVAPASPALPSDPAALRAALFQQIAETYQMTDDIIRVDDELLKDRQPGRGDDQAAYSPEYYRKFYERLGSGIKDQLRKAVETVDGLWTIAWERAGRPQLPPGSVETPPLVVIDYHNGRIVPFDPTHGP
ncbi:MAG: hypothetical protein HY303_06015 [Candidatus Wallbacteria bacterium]|nr:hypothetical protein [Candidatus Wallbacteria bacterium]